MPESDNICWHFCPACGSEQTESDCFLGQLGRKLHFRCRFCGFAWHEPSAEDDTVEKS